MFMWAVVLRIGSLNEEFGCGASPFQALDGVSFPMMQCMWRTRPGWRETCAWRLRIPSAGVRLWVIGDLKHRVKLYSV